MSKPNHYQRLTEEYGKLIALYERMDRVTLPLRESFELEAATHIYLGENPALQKGRSVLTITTDEDMGLSTVMDYKNSTHVVSTNTLIPIQPL